VLRTANGPAILAGDNQPYAVPSLAGCSLVYQARLLRVEPAAYVLCTVRREADGPQADTYWLSPCTTLNMVLMPWR
jgi:hypothetical protein